MPVTLTLAEFAADVRAGDGATDPPEPLGGVLRRYLDTAKAVMTVYVPDDVPTAALNTAASRFAGYLYDSPQAAAGMRFSRVMEHSGAADVLRLFRPMDLYFDTPDTAIAVDIVVMPTPGNPVTSVTIENGQLVVVYEDGTTTREDLPEVDTMPETLMNIGNFDVASTPSDIAAAFTNGSRFRAQSTEPARAPILYAYAAAAPTDLQDYFVLEGLGTFNFVGGVSCWVVTDGAIPGEIANLAIATVT